MPNRFDLHVDEVTGAEVRASASGKYMEHDEHERIVAELRGRIADLEHRLSQCEQSSTRELNRLRSLMWEKTQMINTLVGDMRNGINPFDSQENKS